MGRLQKYFNITGLCYPEKHYMVDLTERLGKIKKLVDRGEYFVINRARQYGKTTTLKGLERYLQSEYMVLPLSFQKISSAKFETEFIFSAAFAEMLVRVIRRKGIDRVDRQIIKELEEAGEKQEEFDLMRLFHILSNMCFLSKQPVVLIIDEVDSASNNQVFLDFLAQLREFYLEKEEIPVFHSVILAGVYDIKNLKLKLRPEEEYHYNSPWNIAAEFNIEMSFSAEEIEGMLGEYEKEYQTGMDRKEMAGLLYDYTSGYPYMVSWLCKYIDESLPEKKEYLDKKMAWTKEGVLEAVKALVNKPNTLTDDMVKKLADYPELKQMLRNILFYGEEYPYNLLHSIIYMASMFGYIKEKEGHVEVANRIMETQLYNLFLSEELIHSKSYKAGMLERNQFIKNGNLDMELVLKKFMEHFTEVYGDSKESFLEENGRRFFLLYLKPIINGVGNYYIEARTRNQKRTDIIVDYRGKQYVIEMKIWRGEEYNQRGEGQLAEYLEYYQLEKGYLLSFNFNQKKTIGIKEIHCNGKIIVEAVV